MDKRNLAGFSIIFSNLALFANGLIARTQSADPDQRKAGMWRMISSLLWASGGIILAKYGNRSVSGQLEKLEDKFFAFLQKEGVPLGEENTKRAEKHLNRSPFRKFEDLLYSYPIESTNIYFSFSSMGMMASGIYRRRGDKASVQAGNANIANAAVSFAGMLTSLIPERTPEQIAARKQTGTLWGAIQKAPLNFAVWLFMASDSFIGMEAKGEYKAAKNLPQDDRFKPWAYAMPVFSLLSMAGALLGDILSGFSSKKAGGSKEEREVAQAKLLDNVAILLADQSPEIQQRAAEYLARQPELRMTDFDPTPLNQKLREAIEKQEKPHTEKLRSGVPKQLQSAACG